jgi:hypothetical protein
MASFRPRKVESLMMRSIRSSGGRPARSPRFRWGEARWLGAVRWALVLSSAIVTLSWIAPPAEADEIEPDSAYEPEPVAEPELEPAPKPDGPPPPEAAREPSEPSWIPSIETGVEVFDYNVDTTLVNLNNSPAWDGTQSEAERQTMFRIGGELMGPMFESLPGRPRLFVKGGAHFRLWSSDQVFGVGDPAVPQEPEEQVASYERRGGVAAKPLPVSFLGQGSAITARIQDPSWYAGLGVAFGVPFGTDRLLYIKPSIQYSMEKIDLRGMLTTVDEPVPMVDPDPCGNNRPDPCTREFFIYRSNEEANTTDHSVGLGLEVAVVPFRNVRPIRVSLYAEARFLWLVSGSTTRFADSDGVATYSVTRDDFNIKGGGGLRFSWVGFD